MNEYNVVYSDEVSALMRVPNNPDMLTWVDNKNEKCWIVVKDTPENTKLFNDKFKNIEFPEGVTIYYNEPYYYDLILDGFITRSRIREEKERQERIRNPKVDLGVNNKKELIEYLVSELLSNEESMMWEYSTDFDVDKAELKAKEKELRRLVNKYLY